MVLHYGLVVIFMVALDSIAKASGQREATSRSIEAFKTNGGAIKLHIVILWSLAILSLMACELELWQKKPRSNPCDPINEEQDCDRDGVKNSSDCQPDNEAIATTCDGGNKCGLEGCGEQFNDTCRILGCGQPAPSNWMNGGSIRMTLYAVEPLETMAGSNIAMVGRIVASESNVHGVVMAGGGFSIVGWFVSRTTP